jgi:hypothetical protein
MWMVTGKPRPELMYVCKQAVKDVIVAGIYSPMFAIAGTGKNVFFNPKVDHLHITTDLHLFGGVPTSDLLSHLAVRSDIAKVCRLIMGAPVLCDNLAGAIRDIGPMPTLESFEIRGEGILARAFRLEMEFERHGTDILPLYNTAWGLECGMEAMFAAMQDITNLAQQNRLLHIAHCLKLAYTMTDKLPGRIPLQINYEREHIYESDSMEEYKSEPTGED